MEVSFARSNGVPSLAASACPLPYPVQSPAEGFGNLLPALVRGECDLVASELTIPPGRQEIVAFSSPYATNWIAVVVRKGTLIAGPADLVGKKAAIIRGSSHGELLQKV